MTQVIAGCRSRQCNAPALTAERCTAPTMRVPAIRGQPGHNLRFHATAISERRESDSHGRVGETVATIEEGQPQADGRCARSACGDSPLCPTRERRHAWEDGLWSCLSLGCCFTGEAADDVGGWRACRLCRAAPVHPSGPRRSRRRRSGIHASPRPCWHASSISACSSRAGCAECR
jgi:hypothetical protein